jgi:hypothetical protein
MDSGHFNQLSQGQSRNRSLFSTLFDEITGARYVSAFFQLFPLVDDHKTLTARDSSIKMIYIIPITNCEP